MPQNDFVIDNATAAEVRTDLNAALQALATLSSGATAPTTTYANMLWYDTANSVLKVRSAADDAWISLFDLDQGVNSATPSSITIDKLNAGSPIFKNITGGTIDVSNGESFVTILGVVSTINGGVAGQVLIVSGASTILGGSVNDTGNVVVPSSRSIIGNATLMLVYDGTEWLEISYRANT